VFVFTGGIPTFKNETKAGQWVLLGAFPRIFSSCIGPMAIPQQTSKIILVTPGTHSRGASR